MNLEEAIKHCDEVAKEKYLQGMLCHANPNDEHLDNCIECAKQHEQLKTWFIEYKKLAEENEILKRENKALDEEVAQKCKLNEQNCKALDKICEILSDCAKMQCGRCPKYKEQGDYWCDICYYDTLNKDQWKEWALHE